VTDAPDVAAPVAGWRAWSLADDGAGPVLESPLVSQWWPVRAPTTATCRYGCLETPSWSCTCGLYAMADVGRLDRTLVRRVPVLGCTALWGRVVECTRGWRAERGYPLFLLVAVGAAVHLRRRALERRALREARGIHDFSPGPESDREVTELLRRRYGVPVHLVSLDGLAAAHGAAARAPARAACDEAARGLAARRFGDRAAHDRLSGAVDELLRTLRGWPPPGWPDGRAPVPAPG
jgi:hypothetical protein